LLLARRSMRDVGAERSRVSLDQLLREGNWAWHGVRLNEPDWGENSHSLAICMEVPSERLWLHVMCNAFWEALEFELPGIEGRTGKPWRRWIDTSLDSPEDIVPWRDARAVPDARYRVESRTVVVLEMQDR
jgi:isoamylase